MQNLQHVGFAGRSHERKQIVVSPVFRNIPEILPDGSGFMEGEPVHQRMEHAALTKTAPDIPCKEEQFHGCVRVFRISADKTRNDFSIVRAAKRTDGCEKVQAFRPG